jgi:hypothetical protein
MPAHTVALSLVVATLAGSAHGAVITTGDGLGADAYVRNGTSANQNFGADTQLLAKTTNGSGWHRVIYLRFDFSAYADATITDATLALTQLAGSGTSAASQEWTFGIFGISDSADDWTEGTGTGAAPGSSGIRFNGQPAPEFASLSGMVPVSASVPLLGVFSITGMSAPGAVSHLSSPALSDFISADADGVVSLAVYRLTSEGAGGGTAYHAFASDEHPSVAGPSVTFTSVPSPGGLAMVGVAGVVLTGRRATR